MSRSGYTEDYEGTEWDLIRWRGAVASAIRGKRGQAFLREALAALDALPSKELIAEELRQATDRPEGAFCTLGAVGHARGTPLDRVDPEDHYSVAHLFTIPHALACEIMYENDDQGPQDETPRARWERMRRWIASKIKGDL